MKTLLAGLTILVIGDSHLAQPGYLLTTLHDALAREGAIVHTYGACGVAAGDWMRRKRTPCGGAVRTGNGPVELTPGTSATTTPFPDLERSLRPDLVVVVMGDTMADYGKPALPKAWIWNQVTTLTRGIREAGTRCFWVGPPWGGEGGKYGKAFARVSEMSDYLEGIVAPCAYVNSTLLARPGEWSTIDGQHFTPTGYRAWGDAIAAAIVAQGSGTSGK